MFAHSFATGQKGGPLSLGRARWPSLALRRFRQAALHSNKAASNWSDNHHQATGLEADEFSPPPPPSATGVRPGEKLCLNLTSVPRQS